MGFYIAMGDCFACRRTFSFNPDRVPSHRDARGERQPICSDCMGRINALRKQRGEPLFPILPGAYEPAEEGEL